MKANELRIGNLVTVNNPKYHPKLKGVILRVTSISPNGDDYSVGLEHINQKPNTYYETYSQFIRFIEPIKLTKKLITDFGIVFEKDYSSWIKGSFNLESKNGNFFFEVYSHYIQVECVHQLQNLYFPLTGEELPVC